MRYVSMTACVLAVLAVDVALAADVAAGKTFFRNACTQCHTAEPTDGGGDVGPRLSGLYGRPAATSDAEFPYNKALRDAKLVWNAEALERFLSNPAAAVPGTTMPMPVPEKSDRDNVIAFFQSLAAASE